MPFSWSSLLLIFPFTCYCVILLSLCVWIRDFAAANMIGAKGLRGKSWPDLDMLPFGWLTDPGKNIKSNFLSGVQEGKYYY